MYESAVYRSQGPPLSETVVVWK